MIFVSYALALLSFATAFHTISTGGKPDYLMFPLVMAVLALAVKP